MKKSLTYREQETLDYIKKIKKEKGYIPSIREIGDEMNLKSTSSAFSRLQSLEKKGYIKRDPTKPRALSIVLDKDENETLTEFTKIPIIGTVAAGTPILAQENIEDYFSMPSEFLHGKESVYMLKVKGDSMINANILNGDYIIVEQKDTAENNEIVVALVEDSATVKRFFKENGHYRLQPENDLMDPIIVDNVKILGHVIGCFRMMGGSRR